MPKRGTLEAVPDAPPDGKQPKLVYDEAPKYRYASVPVDQVKVQGFGSPPDPGLVKSVGLFGLMLPVVLDGRAEGEGAYRMVEGRRRFLAAVQAGMSKVPAMVVTSGDPDLIDPALTLTGNAHTSPNPVIELDAIESLIALVGGGLSLVDIAKATGVPLKVLRRRMRISRLRFELRDAWRDGRFGTKVGEAAAMLDEQPQLELCRRLEANGTVTLEDVREVKRISVTSHARRLPGDRWKERVVETLEKARKDLYLAAGECGAVQKIREAMSAVEDMDEESAS